MRATAWLLLLGPSCSSPSEEAASGSLVPADFRTNGFVEARACRAPGEHSALGGFNVWVNAAAADALEELWAGERDVMPDGSVVVKETFGGAECETADLVAIVAMKKKRGVDPEHGDWLWEERDANALATSDVNATGCINCHRGTASCSSYGELGAKDYLCTEP